MSKSKIDQQIEALKLRKQNINELNNLKESLGKILSDRLLQSSINEHLTKISDRLENGLELEDIEVREKAKPEFTDSEFNVLRSLAGKALSRNVPQQPIQKPAEPSTKQQEAYSDLVQQLSNDKADQRAELLNQPTSSGLADLDPINFHQMMGARMGKIVTDLGGKPLGTLHNQNYPELIIKKPNGNTMELNANKVYVQN